MSIDLGAACQSARVLARVNAALRANQLTAA
jgi:hypothetical protein